MLGDLLLSIQTDRTCDTSKFKSKLTDGVTEGVGSR